ncbi:hypothetical protein EP47_01920 [Legionella norrlandica]|uniref:Uncharacterized protein n=1 Tax=Legionella norrlandica TaxID=1498499 RepID=A0A0A2SN38_9GAMM|nr:hypothetical protein [Legionella norrlandica]KGP62162.1 hypothetical protein EP47_01920 [Legionella norrlandica]
MCVCKRGCFSGCQIVYTTPSLDWFFSTCSVLGTFTTACVIVVLSKGCVFGYWMPKKWKPYQLTQYAFFSGQAQAPFL